MTVTIGQRVSAVHSPSTCQLRPRIEGTNIGTWIGFKHINYLVEEALVEHFRAAGRPVGSLYAQHGVGFEIVYLDTRITGALHIDDLAQIEVQPAAELTDEAELAARVRVTTNRGRAQVKVASSTVRLVLRADGGAEPERTLPADLRRFVVGRIGGQARTLDVGVTNPGQVLARLTAGRNAFAYRWRVPYYYCHYSERLRMSGYLRVMEEAVDRFLASRDLSIRQLLQARRWIPACTRSSIRMLDEALMEEELYVVFTVDDVFKDFTYTSMMDCYALRSGALTHTAAGVVTHGYAAIESRTGWSLVPFDHRVHSGLRGEVGQP